MPPAPGLTPGPLPAALALSPHLCPERGALGRDTPSPRSGDFSRLGLSSWAGQAGRTEGRGGQPGDSHSLCLQAGLSGAQSQDRKAGWVGRAPVAFSEAGPGQALGAWARQLGAGEESQQGSSSGRRGLRGPPCPSVRPSAPGSRTGVSKAGGGPRLLV